MTASVAHLTAVGAAITSGAIVARPYAREWWAMPGTGAATGLLPRVPWSDGAACAVTHEPTGYECTRVRGHGRRHAAGYGKRPGHLIVAVWGSR